VGSSCALTLLSIAPEVAPQFAIAREVTESFRFSREGNSRLWTMRLAHGVTDFLLAHAAHGPCAVVFENVDAADPLDREVIAVLLRRANPDTLKVTVGSRSAEVDEPLAAALRLYARLVEVSPSPRSEPVLDARALAEAFVTSDGTTDDPSAIAAYQSLDPGVRRGMHRDRLAELTSRNGQTLRLGAIPFHVERSDPDVSPFLEGAGYCMRMGYYDACLDLARRGAALVERHEPEYAELGRHIVFSLLLLGRLDEAETFCKETEARNQHPALQSHCAYAMAIMNVRLYRPDKRDLAAARWWIERAIALHDRSPAGDAKVVNGVFLRNTLALVETRSGHLGEALRLLCEGLERLEREAPSRYPVEAVILLNNRARLYILLREPEKALADYTALLRLEPTNSEAHLDRGIVYQRLGRLEDALADFDAAIDWSPPYDEAHFNRAQVLSALGRTAEALHEYDYALEIEPEHLGARINRAGLLCARGDLARAEADIVRALAIDPENAKALCLHGIVQMERGDWEMARRSFDAAVEREDPEPTAWINRATLLFRAGDSEGALRDLDRALAKGANSVALHNRARVLATKTHRNKTCSL
jgi:tetratricopeptide (TPR) repeat protein